MAKAHEAMDAVGGRTLARSEVLSWNRRWSAADKQVLVRHLDRVGAVRFRLVGEGGFVRCLDPQDRAALVVAPGYLVFAPHWVNQECAEDWPGIALSTVRSPAVPAAPASTSRATSATRAPRREPVRRPVEKAPEFCPRCFLQLTTSGTCPGCD